MSPRGRARVGLAAISAAWGSVAVIVRAVSLPATSIAFWRVSIAAAAMLIALPLLGRGRELLPRVARRRLALLGAVLAAHWWLYFEAIKLSSVPLAVLLVYTGPMFIAVLAPLVTGERPSGSTWPALVAGTLGVAVVATDGSNALHATPEGIAAGLAAGFLFALLILTGRIASQRVPATTFVWCETAVATLLLAPAALTDGHLLPPDAASAAGVLALGVLATALLGVAFARVLREVDAPSAGVLMFVEPLSSVFLAWIFLSEEPSLRTLAGGALVLGAGMAVVRADRLEPATLGA